MLYCLDMILAFDEIVEGPCVHLTRTDPVLLNYVSVPIAENIPCVELVGGEGAPSRHVTQLG